MSTKVLHEKTDENDSFSQKLTDFLVKYRKILITGLSVIIVCLITVFIVAAVKEKKSQTASEAIETIQSDWDAARTASDTTDLASKEDEQLAKLEKIYKSNKHSYAGARASMTIAEIYFSRKDWKNAQDAYLMAAKSAPRAYTAGLNYYNAGMCADELGNEDEAIDYFNKANACENFALKSRALFSIGRIEEQRSNKDAAISAYEEVAEKYPDDDWALLAKSRIIALKIK